MSCLRKWFKIKEEGLENTREKSKKDSEIAIGVGLGDKKEDANTNSPTISLKRIHDFPSVSSSAL